MAGVRAATAAAAAPVPGVSAAPPPRYYLVMDFEATCERDDRNWVPEIIEFPAVLVDRKRLTNVAEFREFVRPTEQPQLTSFCTELTNITQADVDGAEPLGAVVERFEGWLAKWGLLEDPLVALPVTCGDWDINRQLPSECKRKQVTVPAPLYRWCNLKVPFSELMGCERAPGMAGMLKALDLPLQGRHHVGIDDCRNLVCLAAELVDRLGTDLAATRERRRPVQAAAQPLPRAAATDTGTGEPEGARTTSTQVGGREGRGPCFRCGCRGGRK